MYIIKYTSLTDGLDKINITIKNQINAVYIIFIIVKTESSKYLQSDEKLSLRSSVAHTHSKLLDFISQKCESKKINII